MTKIGLISDTHGYLDEAVFRHFAACNEIWHAGDFGDISLVENLRQETGLPVKGVYGNIDGQDIKTEFPLELQFECEQVKVFMKHIGGYPGRYEAGVKDEIIRYRPKLFISGHSHILKVMYDDKLSCLHINPGAAGKHGWHKIRTIIRFTIDEKQIKDCEVIELGKR